MKYLQHVETMMNTLLHASLWGAWSREQHFNSKKVLKIKKRKLLVQNYVGMSKTFLFDHFMRPFDGCGSFIIQSLAEFLFAPDLCD